MRMHAQSCMCVCLFVCVAHYSLCVWLLWQLCVCSRVVVMVIVVMIVMVLGVGYVLVSDCVYESVCLFIINQSVSHSFNVS
jgi:hypothetical protein